MLTARSAFACCLSKEFRQIYVVGGSTGQETATDKCEVYDIKADKWTELPDISEKICSASAITLGQRPD